jgi:hypothetical protein
MCNAEVVSVRLPICVINEFKHNLLWGADQDLFFSEINSGSYQSSIRVTSKEPHVEINQFPKKQFIEQNLNSSDF